MSLEEIRKEIDVLDDQIIDLLEKRLNIAKQAKAFKKKVKDCKREDEILQKIKSKYIQNIYPAIFENSRKIQEDLL
jgi:chorismate mutase